MRIVHDADAHKFIAHDDDGQKMGEIEYRPEGDARVEATHTRVNSAFRGRGIAERLLDALVAHARENKLTIIPTCSYVEAAFAKNPEKYANIAAEA